MIRYALLAVVVWTSATHADPKHRRVVGGTLVASGFGVFYVGTIGAGIYKVEYDKRCVSECGLGEGLMIFGSAAVGTAITAIGVPLLVSGSSRDGRHADRHVGAHVGLYGAVSVDVDYEPVYAFVSTNALVTGISAGDTGVVAVGVGPSWQIAGSGWRLDAFATAIPSWGLNRRWSPIDLSAGVGIGVRYASDDGFEIGFKIPVIGIDFGDTAAGIERTSGFYTTALASFPIVSVGYRF